MLLRQRLPWIVLVAIAAIWGTTFVIEKDALGVSNVPTFLTFRFVLAGLAGAAISGRKLLERRHLVPGLWIGVVLFAGFAFQTAGLALTTPARSAFITGLFALFVPFVAYAVFRRLPSPWTAVGIVVATIGLALLTFDREGARTADTLVGDLLTLACALAYAAHVVLSERFAKETDAIALVTVQAWVVAVGSAIWMARDGVVSSFTTPFWVPAAYLGVVATIGAIAAQNWALRTVPSARAALIVSLEPVFAAALSVGIGRETLDVWAIGGGALMMAGVIIDTAAPTRAGT